jgi:hypothetical protein
LESPDYYKSILILVLFFGKRTPDAFFNKLLGVDKRPLELKCAISLVRLGKWEYVSKHFRTAVYFRELN